MAYKAVVFDLDGTLVHTMPEYRYKIVGQTLKELGTSSSKHYIDRFWFETRRDDIIKEHFEVDVDLFWKTFRQCDTIDLRKQLTRVYDDVGFVKELKQKGYKVGIVTGAPLHIMSLEVDMIGEEYFDAVVRAQLSSGIKPKPDPHGIEECLSILGVKKALAEVRNQVIDLTILSSSRLIQQSMQRKTAESLVDDVIKEVGKLS